MEYLCVEEAVIEGEAATVLRTVFSTPERELCLPHRRVTVAEALSGA